MIAAIELPAGYHSDRLHSVITATTGSGISSLTLHGNSLRSVSLSPNYKAATECCSRARTARRFVCPSCSLSIICLNERKIRAASGWNPQRKRSRTAFRQHGELQKTPLRQQNRERTTRSRGAYPRARSAGIHYGASETGKFTPLNSTLKIHYSLTVPHYAKPTGPLLLIRPRYSAQTRRRSIKSRVPIPWTWTTPGCQRHVRSGTAARLYSGRIPDPVKLDTDFASYSSQSEFKGSTVRYTREYTVKQIEIPANRYADLQRLNSRIEADERNSAVLKKIN